MNLVAPMYAIPLLGRFWSRRRRAAAADDALRLQARGLDAAQLQQLQQLLEPLAEQLAIHWRLVADDADVVLVAGPGAAAAPGTAPQLLVCDLPRADETPHEVAARFERRQRRLLAQLRALPAVRRRSPHFGASGWDPDFTDTQPGEPMAETPSDPFDTLEDDPAWNAPSLPLEDERMLRRLRQAWVDRDLVRLSASYGEQAHIEFDFELGQAWLDLAALRALRVQRRLPALVPACRAGHEAVPCDPAQVLWDLGLAAGGHRLLDQPLDWWAARLHAPDTAALMRQARLPQHRRLVAVLAAGPTTAQELCHLADVPLPVLRGFVQAALMLRLLRWEP